VLASAAVDEAQRQWRRGGQRRRRQALHQAACGVHLLGARVRLGRAAARQLDSSMLPDVPRRLLRLGIPGHGGLGHDKLKVALAAAAGQRLAQQLRRRALEATSVHADAVARSLELKLGCRLTVLLQRAQHFLDSQYIQRVPLRLQRLGDFSRLGARPGRTHGRADSRAKHLRCAFRKQLAARIQLLRPCCQSVAVARARRRCR
jgi:hypothetical protein